MNFRLKKFPYIEQLDSADCGIACIRMICKYYGVNIATDNKAFLDSNLTKQGLMFSELMKISSTLGFDNLFVELDYEEIEGNVKLPAIFFWKQSHYIVVYRISKDNIYICDPSSGRRVLTKKRFLEGWHNKNKKGFILLLQPTENLFLNQKKEKTNNIKSLKNILRYMLNYKKQIYYLSIILLFSSILEFLFPFFTQIIIDKGVHNKDFSFLYLTLFAQIVLFISKIINEFYRSWLFIHISSRVSLKLVSDFLIKLMSLPINFFSSKSIGDLLERINDHKRVENFLTNDLIKSVFAFFSMVVFSIILLNYSKYVFFVFVVGNSLQLIWIFIYLDKLKEIDKRKFRILGVGNF